MIIRLHTLPSVTLSLIALAISSCDVMNEPYREDNTVTPPPATEQVVLIEDFTGHLCVNCPAAAVTASEIEKVFGKNRVIILAIHVGQLANPAPPKFTHDFRTTMGTDLDKTFKISVAGIPRGTINRIPRNGNILLDHLAWSQFTAEALKRTPPVELTFRNTNWSAENKNVSTDVEVKYLSGGNQDYHLVVVLAEDSIKGAQADARVSIIEDYTFNHTLRTALNGTWGEQLSADPVPAGTVLTRSFNFTFPAGVSWNPAHCHLIAYVHRHNSTREIMQAARIALPI